MRLRVILLACACLAVALCLGCTRSEEAPPEEGPAVEPGPASTVQKGPASRPAPGAGQPPLPAAVGSPPRAAEDDTPPFRVCALLSPKEGVARCGVIQKGAGPSRVLQVGDSFLGYRLAQVIYEAESAVFQKGNTEITLRLTEGEAAPADETAPPFPQAGGRTNSAGIDLTKIKPQQFEPADWETEAGIDPNDPKTWPRGYRGPAIERLVRERPSPENQVNLPLESARKMGALEDE